MILYLPGFSIKNKEESTTIYDSLLKNGYHIMAYEWSHWSDPQITFNVDNELLKIQELIKDEEVDIVIAKSIGTYVTARLIWDKSIDPKKIILLGVPFNDLDADEQELMQIALRRVQDKLIFIHNTKDPHGGVEELNRFILALNNNLILKDSDTHEYPYTDDILSLIRA